MMWNSGAYKGQEKHTSEQSNHISDREKGGLKGLVIDRFEKQNE